MRSILQSIELPHLKADIPEFNSGDTVRVHVRVVEGNRERTQVFEGVVIRYRGAGINRNFTVRRIASGVGVERTFLVNSPRVEKIEVVRYGKVRRANLYYLRGRTGKAARIKERRYVPAAKAAANRGGGAASSDFTPGGSSGNAAAAGVAGAAAALAVDAAVDAAIDRAADAVSSATESSPSESSPTE